MFVYLLFGPGIDESIRTLREIKAMGATGYLLFALGYVLIALLMLPASLMTIAAGAIFGTTKGIILVSLSSTLAACVAFITSRWMLRDAIEPWIRRSPIFQAIDRAIELESFRAVILIRTSPVFPYNLTNYAFGITKLSFKEFALGSWLGMLPGTIVYVWVGSAANSIHQALSGDASGATATPRMVLFVVGAIATLATVTLIGRRAKQELDDIIAAGGDDVVER